MAVRKRFDGPLQERLREVAAELRQTLYGEQGFPEWGTKFSEIEEDGMSVGLELARLMMEQSVAEQAGEAPEGCLACGEETAQPAGTDEAQLQTEAGTVVWDEPAAYLKQARRAFFPSASGVGDQPG